MSSTGIYSFLILQCPKPCVSGHQNMNIQLFQKYCCSKRAPVNFDLVPETVRTQTYVLRAILATKGIPGVCVELHRTHVCSSWRGAEGMAECLKAPDWQINYPIAVPSIELQHCKNIQHKKTSLGHLKGLLVHSFNTHSVQEPPLGLPVEFFLLCPPAIPQLPELEVAHIVIRHEFS